MTTSNIHPVFQNIFNQLGMTQPLRIPYRGWIIEEETDPWALQYGFKYRYYREDDENIRGASTLEEAKDEIMEMTASIPSHMVILNGRSYDFKAD